MLNENHDWCDHEAVYTMNLINTKIPRFEAQAFHDQDFKTITNEDLNGKWTVLFFYPADFTFVCPTELADMAEMYSEFQKIDTQVYSVSTDTHFVHKAWWDTSDTIKKIKFPMIADPTGYLCCSLGTYIDEEGLSCRATFIIDPDGYIKVAEYSDNSIGRNAEEILRKVQASQFVAQHGGEVCPARWKPGAKTLKTGIDLVGKI